MKKYLLLIVLLCCCLYSCFAQLPRVNSDSLKRLLVKASADTDRVSLLAQLMQGYGEYKPDSTLFYGREMFALGKKLRNDDVMVFCYFCTSYANRYKDNYAEALKLELQAVRILEKGRDTNYLANNYNLLSTIYKSMENYPKALYYSRLCEKLALSCKGWGNVGLSYMNRGGIYEKTGLLDSAEFYITKAIKFDKEYNLSHYANLNNFLLGSIAFKRGNYRLARKYYDTALALSVQRHDLKNQSDICYAFAKFYQKLSKPDSALYYANKAFAAAQSSAATKPVYLAAGLLSNLHEERHATDSAFKYLKIGAAAKDSVYSAARFKDIANMTTDEFLRQTESEAREQQYRSRLKIYLLLGVGVLFFVVALILLRHNRTRQKAYALLTEQKNQTDIQRANTENALKELKATQAQLIQSEKMASLGELTAGIAHEIQNPLNFVNNFSEVNREMIDELKEELAAGNLNDALAIANDIQQNSEKINQHGKRADGIVKGMLQHSRTAPGETQPTDINVLIDEFLKLSYNGFRVKDKMFNAELIADLDKGLPKLTVIQQDIGRVLLNLFNNAFYAVNEKAKTAEAGYKPRVEVSTRSVNGHLQISVHDNGVGIADAIKDKILQPFFTTKPTGQGTGLGLSLSYDIIVKGHRGEIDVITNEGAFTTFIISLPL